MTAPQDLQRDSICNPPLINRRVKALATPTVLGASLLSIEGWNYCTTGGFCLEFVLTVCAQLRQRNFSAVGVLLLPVRLHKLHPRPFVRTTIPTGLLWFREDFTGIVCCRSHRDLGRRSRTSFGYAFPLAFPFWKNSEP